MPSTRFRKRLTVLSADEEVTNGSEVERRLICVQYIKHTTTVYQNDNNPSVQSFLSRKTHDINFKPPFW